MKPLHSEDAGQPSDLKSGDDESDEEVINESEEEEEEMEDMDCDQSFDSKSDIKEEEMDSPVRDIDEKDSPLSQNGSTSSKTLGLYSSFDNIVTGCYQERHSEEKPFSDSSDSAKLDDHDISAHLKGTLSFGIPNRGRARFSLPYKLVKKRGKTTNFVRTKKSKSGILVHKPVIAGAGKIDPIKKVEKKIEMDNIDHLNEEMQFAYRIVKELMSDSLKASNSIFMETIELDPKINGDYLEVVKRPIWLPKIKENLLNGEYKNITEVVFQLRLMLENTYRYFGTTHSFSRRGLRMEFILEQKLNSLPSELKKNCTISATHGVSDDIKNESRPTRIKTSTITVNGEKYFSYIMHSVRGCRLAREKELKQKRMDLMRKAKLTKEGEVVKWEERLTNGPLGGPIKNMWELVQINQFLFLSLKVLNIYEISQYEMERMLMLPEASMTLRMLMTALVLSRQQRAKFTEKPYMPYSVWAQRLASKTLHWYRVYTREKKNPEKVFDQLGIEPKFWSVCGQKNPFEKHLFHELTLYQRVWLLKSLCDYIAHSHKSVQECIAEQPEDSLRERLLGRDSEGFEYFHFPQFANSDVRVYRRSKMKIEMEEDKSNQEKGLNREEGNAFSKDQIKSFRKLIKKIKKNQERDSDWEEEHRRSSKGSPHKRKKRGRPSSLGSSAASTPDKARTRPQRLRQTPKSRSDLYSCATFGEGGSDEEDESASWSSKRRRKREESSEEEEEEEGEGEDATMPRAKVKNRRKNSIACKTCGKTFLAKSAMYGHMAMHVRKKEKAKSQGLEEKGEEESNVKEEISDSASVDGNLTEKKEEKLIKKEVDANELNDKKEKTIENSEIKVKNEEENPKSDKVEMKLEEAKSDVKMECEEDGKSLQSECSVEKSSASKDQSNDSCGSTESKCVDDCNDVEDVPENCDTKDDQSNLGNEKTVENSEDKGEECAKEDPKCDEAIGKNSDGTNDKEEVSERSKEDEEKDGDTADKNDAVMEEVEASNHKSGTREEIKENCDKESAENEESSSGKNEKSECSERAVEDTASSEGVKSARPSRSNSPSGDSTSAGTPSVVEPEPAEPVDFKEFELVAASFLELRNLILRFGSLPPKCAKEKKKVDDAGEEPQDVNKEDTEGEAAEDVEDEEEEEGEEDVLCNGDSKVPACELRLHRRLCKYLTQLAPFEAKINTLHKQLRKKLYNEYMHWFKRDATYVDPAEDAWVSDPEPEPAPSATQTPKQSSSSSSSEEEFNEDGSRKRKLRKRRAKRVTTFEQPHSPVAETASVPSPSSPPAAEDRIAVSSRGRVRKVKRIVNYDRLDFDKLAENAEKDSQVQKAKKKRMKEDEIEDEGSAKKLVEAANSMQIPSSGVRKYILSKTGEVVGYVGNDGRVHSGRVTTVSKEDSTQARRETPPQKAKEKDNTPKIVVSAENESGMPVYVRMVGAQALELVRLIEATKNQPPRQVKLQRFMQTYTFNTNSHIMTQNIPGYPDSDTSNPQILSQKTNIPSRASASSKTTEMSPIKVTPKKPAASPVASVPVTCRSPNPVALAYQGLPSSTTSTSATTNLMSLPTPSTSLSYSSPVSSLVPPVSAPNATNVSTISLPTISSAFNSPSGATLSASTRLVFASPSAVPSVRPITASSEQVTRPPSSDLVRSITTSGNPQLVQTENGQQIQIALGSDRLAQLAQKPGQRVVAVPNDKGGYTISLISMAGAQQAGRTVTKAIPGQVALAGSAQKSVITQLVPAVVNTSSGSASPCLKDGRLQPQQLSIVGTPPTQHQQQVLQQVVSGASAVGRQVVIQHTPTTMPQQQQQQVIQIAQGGSVGQQQIVHVQPQTTPKVLQLVQTSGGRQLLQVLQPGQVMLGAPSNTSPQGGVVVQNSQGIQCAKQAVAPQQLILQHSQQQQPSKIIQVAQPEQYVQAQTQQIQYQNEQIQVVQPQQHIIFQQGVQPNIISSSTKPSYTHTPPTEHAIEQQSSQSQPEEQSCLNQSYVTVTQPRKVLHQTQIQPQQAQVQQPPHTFQQPVQAVQPVQIQQQSQQPVQQSIQLQQAQPAQQSVQLQQSVQIQQSPQTIQQPVQIQQQSQQQAQQQPKENSRQQMGRLVLLQMNDGQKVYLQMADGRYSLLSTEQLQPLISSGAIKLSS